MRDRKQMEFRFWRALAVLFCIPVLPCLIWPPARFGAVFFGALTVGCAGEAVAVWLADRGRPSRSSPAAVPALPKGKALSVTACGGASSPKGRAKWGAALWVARLGRLLFTLFLVSFLLIQGVILSGCQPDPEAENADFVLVLGAQIYADRPSASLQTRLDTARDYLERNPNAQAILCGGKGSNEIMPEAWMMRDYLLARGVSEERLLIEDKSSNTIQNIANARREFLPEGVRTAVITNEFHLARARRLMDSAGLDPYGLPAPTPYLSVRIIQHLREYCSVLGLMVSGRWF